MGDWKTSFTFPVFYTAVIKNNTRLFQYDAGNALLLGITSSDFDIPERISDDMVSRYIAGRKPISKSLLAKLACLSSDECLRRIVMAQIEDTRLSVTCALSLINSGHIIMDDMDINYFTAYPASSEPERFLADLFLYAVKRPKLELQKLNAGMIRDILSYRTASNESEYRETNISEDLKIPLNTIKANETFPASSNVINEKSQTGNGIPILSPTRPLSTARYCINTSEKDYYILDDYQKDDYLETAPSEFRIICLYYITLSDARINHIISHYSGDDIPLPGVDYGYIPDFDYYLLLKHDNYVTDFPKHQNSAKNRHSIWSVPFTTFVVRPDREDERLRTIQSIRSFFQSGVDSLKHDIQVAETQLMYQLGVHCGKDSIKPGKSYIEYKPSILQPDRWKCYYIQEYYITNIDSADVINLTDPEGLYGYKYFLLPSLTSIKSEKQNLKSNLQTENGKIRFLDKLIPENISQHIIDPTDLMQHAIPIQIDDLFYRMPGVFLKVEAYPNTLDYTTEGMSQIHTARSNIKYILKDSDITPYNFYGNGFIALFPGNPSSESLKFIFKLIDRIHQTLNNYKSGEFEDTSLSFGLRCSLLYADSFDYGCIYYLGDSHASVNDEIIVLLEEMENTIRRTNILPNRTSISGNIDFLIDSRLLKFAMPDHYVELSKRKRLSFTDFNGNQIEVAHFLR